MEERFVKFICIEEFVLLIFAIKDKNHAFELILKVDCSPSECDEYIQQGNNLSFYDIKKYTPVGLKYYSLETTVLTLNSVTGCRFFEQYCYYHDDSNTCGEFCEKINKTKYYKDFWSFMKTHFHKVFYPSQVFCSDDNIINLISDIIVLDHEEMQI